jgi:DNA-binding NarL/FixJ family response regulator
MESMSGHAAAREPSSEVGADVRRFSHATLTPRERDLVRGIITGRTNRELARELGLNEQSVKNVLSTIYLKCHVRNRLELALFAVKHPLLRD